VRSQGLESGSLLPEILTPPPGPRARVMAGRLEASEAPGINTLVAGATAMLWDEALGSNVVDVDGNRYIDLTAGFGVAAVGHRHPAVVTAVREQAEQLVHGLGDVYAHPARLELAERLCSLAPLADPRVYFAVSGADAVEIALKTGRLHSGRPGVLAFEPAYHGTTLGALAATARPPAGRRPAGWPTSLNSAAGTRSYWPSTRSSRASAVAAPGSFAAKPASNRISSAAAKPSAAASRSPPSSAGRTSRTPGEATAKPATPPPSSPTPSPAPRHSPLSK